VGCGYLINQLLFMRFHVPQEADDASDTESKPGNRKDKERVHGSSGTRLHTRPIIAAGALKYRLLAIMKYLLGLALIAFTLVSALLFVTGVRGLWTTWRRRPCLRSAQGSVVAIQERLIPPEEKPPGLHQLLRQFLGWARKVCAES